MRNVYMPSQSLTLSADPKMLVSELKRQLSVKFPSAPAVSTQKLIFGGKICGDDEPLEQILFQMQSSHLKDGGNSDRHLVFHLLVTSSGVQKNVEPKAQAEAQDSPRPSDSAAPEPNLVVDQPETQQSNNQPEIRIPTLPPPFVPGHTQPHHHTLYRQSVLMQQQALILHQIQYLQMMLMQQQIASTSTAPPSTNFASPYGNFYGMMQPQMSQARSNVSETVAQEPVATVPAQTQAPTTSETHEEPRRCSVLVEMMYEVFRLLDFRLAFKMAFMLLIIGKDTPMDRVYMLILLSLISYLHITGIFAKVYEIYNRRRSRNGNAGLTDSNAPGAAAGADAAIISRYNTLVRVLRISADRGFSQDIRCFVIGLLLSLVPAWRPQPIQGAAPMADNAVPDDVPLQGI